MGLQPGQVGVAAFQPSNRSGKARLTLRGGALESAAQRAEFSPYMQLRRMRSLTSPSGFLSMQTLLPSRTQTQTDVFFFFHMARISQ